MKVLQFVRKAAPETKKVTTGIVTFGTAGNYDFSNHIA